MTSPSPPRFEAALWASFVALNIVTDFGRPFAALQDTPLSLPSAGDALHLLYNLAMPTVLLALVWRARPERRRVPAWAAMGLAVTLATGASVHLVGDSVNHRLILLGYENHVPLEENELFRGMRPELLDVFRLLYFFDEVLGHHLWYVALFGLQLAYYDACHGAAAAKKRIRGGAGAGGLVASALAAAQAAYHWYLASEGQITELYLVTLACMLALTAAHAQRGRSLDANGVFMLRSFAGGAALLAAWAWWLWDDADLRERYPELVYMPEPWSWYTLQLSRQRAA